jgi:hypothetical protein
MQSATYRHESVQHKAGRGFSGMEYCCRCIYDKDFIKAARAEQKMATKPEK